MSLAQKVPLYNSDGYGSCQRCGTPTYPRLLLFFDGRWVCRYCRFKHTRAEFEEASSASARKYRHFIMIEGSLGAVSPDGEAVPFPPTAPPPDLGGGGGSVPPPNPGGGGGSGNPPPDTNPPGGIPPGMQEGNLCLK